MINEIRERMTATKVSQAELSDRTGMSRQRINAIMRGKPAKVETLRRIVESLGGELNTTIKWK